MAHAHVVTISDRCSAGSTTDTSGPYISERLEEWRPGIRMTRHCVSDDVIRIQGALNRAVEQAASVRGHVKLSLQKLSLALL